MLDLTEELFNGLARIIGLLKAKAPIVPSVEKK